MADFIGITSGIGGGGSSARPPIVMSVGRGGAGGSGGGSQVVASEPDPIHWARQAVERYDQAARATGTALGGIRSLFGPRVHEAVQVLLDLEEEQAFTAFRQFEAAVDMLRTRLADAEARMARERTARVQDILTRDRHLQDLLDELEQRNRRAHRPRSAAHQAAIDALGAPF